MTTTISVTGGPIMTDVAFRREYLGERMVLSNRHVPQLRSAGIRACVLPVDGLKDFNHFLREVEESDGTILELDDSSQLNGFDQEDSTGFILCGSFKTIGEDRGSIGLYHRLGMRMFSLTLNRRNLLADGCSERRAAGLSAFGIDVVRELARRRIMIDVSHSSVATFWDVLETVEVPIIASHSNAHSVCPHLRNLGDDQIKALAGRGGLIGLSMHPTMVAATDPTAENVIDHLDHMIDLVGIDYVALGTDYIDHVIAFLHHKLAAGDPSGTLYSAEDHTYPLGIETVSKIGRLSQIMLERGYSDEEVRKVCWDNFSRYWQAVQS